jgi:hypothetical protein
VTRPWKMSTAQLLAHLRRACAPRTCATHTSLLLREAWMHLICRRVIGSARTCHMHGKSDDVLVWRHVVSIAGMGDPPPPPTPGGNVPLFEGVILLLHQSKVWLKIFNMRLSMKSSAGGHQRFRTFPTQEGCTQLSTYSWLSVALCLVMG